MDGGNINSINLDSPLDISTSDMLVPASQPTFQHNWQKFQGKFLPNSLRFEKNGWAAGWNVYNFKYNALRIKLADDVWVELGTLNKYVKQLNVYESENSTKVLATYIVVPETQIASGEAAVNGNMLTGNINGKSFILDLTDFTISSGFSVEHSTMVNHTEFIKVVDADSAIDIDFDLLVSSVMSGDGLEDIAFESLSGTTQSWGNYKYNVSTGRLTTPEGVQITPTVTDNLLTFDYTAHTDDEVIPILYTFDKYYPKFKNIVAKDLSNDEMIIGSSPSESYDWNYYKAHVSPNELAFGDDGIIVDWQLPLWASCGFNVQRTDPNAKLCDNVANFEIALRVGTGVNTKVKWNNAYDASYSGSMDLVNNYRSKAAYPQYITGMSKRFNQILVGNTIEPGATNANYNKYTLKTSDIWYLNSRQFANLRGKKTAQMTKYLGNVYTWGSFTYKATDYFEINSPWDWIDPDNCVYTMPDISDILSVKVKGDIDNTDTGDDGEFIADNLPVDMKIIARLTGATTGYVPTQAFKTYDQLYSGGTYIGGTYEFVGTDDSEEGFWPFEQIPKFNFARDTGTLDASGNKVYENIDGVYWTNGNTVITDYDEFREMVLGAYDDNFDAQNSCLTPNANYSRKRIVKTYKACYDFDYRTLDDFSGNTAQTAYMDWLDKANAVWAKYYPEYSSPYDTFDNTETYDDSMYLDFNDIEVVSNVKPDIAFVKPGVYAGGTKYAVLYDTSTGLIMLDEASDYSLEPFVYHHTKEALTTYVNRPVTHEHGFLYFKGTFVDLPYYFGSKTTERLAYGVENYTRFASGTVRAILRSAEVTLGLNYKYERVYVTEDYTDDDGGTSTFGYYKYQWNPQTPAVSNWFGAVRLAFSRNRTTVYDATLNSGVSQVSKYYTIGDINSGIKLAWPVWGHSATLILYPDMRTMTNINDNDAFITSSLPSSDLANDTLIFWDRDDTDKAVKLFTISENSKQPDDSQGHGNITLSMAAVDSNSVLWYRKKETDQNNKEVKLANYAPGICFNGITDTSGGLTVTDNQPTLKLEWVPVVYKIPNGVNATYVPVNALKSRHRYYTEDCKTLVPTMALGVFDIDTMTMPITMMLNGVVVQYTYDVENQKTVYDGGAAVILSNDTETLELKDIKGTGENAQVLFSLDMLFNNNKARFYKVNNGLTLVEANASSVTLSKGTIQIKYNISGRSVTSPKADYRVDEIANGVHVSITAVTSQSYNVAIKNFDSAFEFVYKGNTYSADIDKLLDFNPGVRVLSTDIKHNETKEIGFIDSSSQYQIVRQQWNTTVEVENYWWVDSRHVLELGQSHFILKRKTDELDDWNGDRFEKLWSIQRSDILPTNVLRYFVTNCYNTNYSALFVTMQMLGSSIQVSLYDIREKFELLSEFYVEVRNVDIGKVLNDVTFVGDTAYCNTYSVFNTSYVLSKAQFSNTLTGNYFVFGIHLSNNFDQWAVVYNLETKSIVSVIQGYGYVGIKGDLTGGQIPNDYFDITKGFNDRVQDFSVLNPLDERDLDNLDAAYEMTDRFKSGTINYIEPKVVGTSEQQWYICNKLYGVVSHLTFEDGQYIKQLLPITNNYSASFFSPSWASSVLGDNMVQAVQFSKLFNFDGAAGVVWEILCGVIGEPLLYSIAPRFMTICYINMSFGQYAYVHYNSSKSMPEKEFGQDNAGNEMAPEQGKDNKQTDPTLSSSMSFDKQKFTQGLRMQFSTASSMMVALLIAFAQAVNQTANEKLSVNEETAQSAVSDFGRKFSDNALANTTDMLGSNITTSSRFFSGITGVVTGMKSLDMFYSTSDQQKVMAGPGFVEHQLVANCVAQSSTTVQLEGKTYQFYWCLTSLTTMQLEIEIEMIKTAAENLRKLAENFEGATGPCGVNYGAGLAAAFTAAATALEYSVIAMTKAKEALEVLLEELSKNGVTVNQDAYVSRHSLSTEGKHKYGEKNETFMWPCWGIEKNKLKYTDEWVEAGMRITKWRLSLASKMYYTFAYFNYLAMMPMYYNIPTYSSAIGELHEFYDIGNGGAIGVDEGGGMSKAECLTRAANAEGRVPLYQAACLGTSIERTLPDDMAKIEGVKKFLPEDPFRNENIAVSEPAFAPSLFQDYKIAEEWDLGMCCTYGLIQWLTIKDTKITNCAASNMVINSDFCGVATPYSAVEVKRGLSKAYMRPYAITPNTLALNCTGYNAILDNKLYHAFDGMSYRIVDLVGSPGLNKNRQTFFYSFQKNDRFKRSNKFPANEIQGNFESEPSQALETIDELFTLMTIASKQKGIEGGTIGEDKDATRWAIPVLTEPVTTLPAAVKTLTAMPLNVYDGITALTTNLGNNQTAYKAPLSVDFTIGKNVYRQTEEYICSVQTQGAIDVVTELVPSLGLTYIGATPTEAYFYSHATRHYYMFTGTTLVKMDMMERFRNIQKGYWDFVNQEVIMPCLMTFKRLNAEVEDKDSETDNIIVPVLSKGQVSGELIPPLTTIFNDRSWYKAVSLPAGFAYQGPNRVIVNRSVFCEYMLDSLKSNLGKWLKMNREKYTTKRVYSELYDTVDKDVSEGIDGWTHNPFVLVTSPLGNDEDTDCIFEWTITFCWPIEMDLIYGVDNYAVVNVTAETMTPGGKVKSRPTHIFLTKELFTRNGNYGYYSFRYQSKNGAGNRERLHIWSDQYIAISKLDCEIKQVTNRRNEQLLQQLDVQKLKEL